MTTEQSKLADKIEYAIDTEGTAVLYPKDASAVVAALRASPAVLDQVTVEALAAKMFALEYDADTYPFEKAHHDEQKLFYQFAMVAIRALIGHPANKGEPK